MESLLLFLIASFFLHYALELLQMIVVPLIVLWICFFRLSR